MLARITDPFALVNEEFDRMLGRAYRGPQVPSTLAPYAVDVHEDADRFHVEAELPGFGDKDVDITLEDGVLSIRAERKEETKHEGKDRQPLHIERRWTTFQRSFTLPTAVNENTVKAELTDGILKITMDKREETKPRKIQVTAGNGHSKQLDVEKKA